MKTAKSILKNSKLSMSTSRVKSAKKTVSSPAAPMKSSKVIKKSRDVANIVDQPSMSVSINNYTEDMIKSKVSEIMNDEKSDIARSIKSSRNTSLVNDSYFETTEPLTE